MKITAISNNYTNFNYPSKLQQKHYQSFEGKGGEIVGGVIGSAAAGIAGGAAVGGGSLAGVLLLAASGPVGWGIASVCTIGSAIAGGWLGSKLGDKITENNKKKK